MRPDRRPLRGLSLTEVVGALIIASFVIIAALETVAGAMSTLAWTNDGVKAVMLAEQRMAEALYHYYEDPDGNSVGVGRELDEPSNPTNRLGFDDIDDYDGTSDSPPRSLGGGTSAGFGGWTLAFEVDHVEIDPGPSGTFQTSASETGLKRVLVRLTDPSGRVTELYALRSSDGPNEAPVPFSTDQTPLFKVIATIDDDADLEQASEILNGGDQR